MCFTITLSPSSSLLLFFTNIAKVLPRSKFFLRSLPICAECTKEPLSGNGCRAVVGNEFNEIFSSLVEVKEQPRFGSKWHFDQGLWFLSQALGTWTSSCLTRFNLPQRRPEQQHRQLKLRQFARRLEETSFRCSHTFESKPRIMIVQWDLKFRPRRKAAHPFESFLLTWCFSFLMHKHKSLFSCSREAMGPETQPIES